MNTFNRVALYIRTNISVENSFTTTTALGRFSLEMLTDISELGDKIHAEHSGE